MNKALTQYLETALWSSVDNDGNPLDTEFSVNDIDTDSVQKASRALDSFIDLCGNLLDGYDLTDMAHDFWLTRNHHGAGFWDGDYGNNGDKLTEIAQAFGESDLYVGDDNKLHLG